MELDHDTNVAVDERPLVRPLTGNQPTPPTEEWEDEDDEDEDLDDLVTASETDETADEESAEEEEEEEDSFADDERDPFARAPVALISEPEEDAEVEAVETRSPVILDDAVYARIADCLRAAIAAADDKLGPARDLAEREPFYAGFVKVIEAQRRRYVRALDRVLPQAVTASIVPSEADEVEIEPALV